MKKLYLYLLANFFVLVVLSFLLDYLFLSLLMQNTDDSEGKFVQFLALLLSILSMQASILLSLSSITIFLNLIPAVRKNWLLSFISFCGISIGYLVYLFVDNFANDVADLGDFVKIIKPYLIILTMQFVLTFISFILFRKRLKKLESLN